MQVHTFGPDGQLISSRDEPLLDEGPDPVVAALALLSDPLTMQAIQMGRELMTQRDALDAAVAQQDAVAATEVVNEAVQAAADV